MVLHLGGLIFGESYLRNHFCVNILMSLYAWGIIFGVVRYILDLVVIFPVSLLINFFQMDFDLVTGKYRLHQKR